MKITQNLLSSENLKTLSQYKENFQRRNLNQDKIPFKRNSKKNRTKSQAFLVQSSSSKRHKTERNKKATINIH